MGVASLRRDTFFAFCDIRIIKEELKLKAKLRRLTKGVTHFLLFCDIWIIKGGEFETESEMEVGSLEAWHIFRFLVNFEFSREEFETESEMEVGSLRRDAFFNYKGGIEIESEGEAGSLQVWHIFCFFVTFELWRGELKLKVKLRRALKRCDAFFAFLWHSNYQGRGIRNWKRNGNGLTKGVTHFSLFCDIRIFKGGSLKLKAKWRWAH